MVHVPAPPQRPGCRPTDLRLHRGREPVPSGRDEGLTGSDQPAGLRDHLLGPTHLVAVDLEHDPARLPDEVVAPEVHANLLRVPWTCAVVLAPGAEGGPAQVEPGHRPPVRSEDGALGLRLGQTPARRQEPEPGLAEASRRRPGRGPEPHAQPSQPTEPGPRHGPEPGGLCGEPRGPEERVDVGHPVHRPTAWGAGTSCEVVGGPRPAGRRSERRTDDVVRTQRRDQRVDLGRGPQLVRPWHRHDTGSVAEAEHAPCAHAALRPSRTKSSPWRVRKAWTSRPWCGAGAGGLVGTAHQAAVARGPAARPG